MPLIATTTSSIFSTGHIAYTGALSGLLAGLFAVFWVRGERRVLDALAIGLVTAAAVFLFRKSANMPQLNDDGLKGYSANDWLAPVLTYVMLGLYAAVRPFPPSRRFDQARAAAVVIAFAVNVITI